MPRRGDGGNDPNVFSLFDCNPGHANDVSREPSLVANTIEYYRPFMLKDLKITPIRRWDTICRRRVAL